MLQLSVKGRYGLCAMIDLALRQDHGPIQLKVIAERHGIPLKFLEVLFSDLKRSNLITSYRGANGGYTLSRSAEEITVANILTCLEGPLELKSGQKGCDAMLFFWTEVEEAIHNLFDRSLMDVVRRKQKLEKMLTYEI